MRRIKIYFSLIVHLFLFWCNIAYGSNVERVINIAEVKFREIKYVSNVVETTLIPRLSIEGPSAVKVKNGEKGKTVQLLSVLNGAEGAYKIKLLPVSGDFNPNNVNIFMNGSLILEDDLIVIESGVKKEIEIVFSPNYGIKPGEYGKVMIEAVEKSSGRKETKIITFIVEESKQKYQLDINLESEEEVAVGDKIKFTAKLKNSGKSSLQPVQIMVDGEPEQAVLMGLVLPEGVKLVSHNENGGEVLFKKRKSSPRVYTRREKEEDEKTDYIAVGVSKKVLEKKEEIGIELTMEATKDIKDNNEFYVAMQSMNVESLEEELVNGDKIIIKKVEPGPDEPYLGLEVPEFVKAGESFDYKLTFKNTTTITLSTLEIYPLLPDGFEFIKETLSGTPLAPEWLDGNNRMAIHGDITPEMEIDINVKVRVSDSIEEGTKNVSVTGEAYNDTSNYKLSKQEKKIDVYKENLEGIEINKRSNKSYLKQNDFLDYKISLKNVCGTTLDRIEVYDEKPLELEIDAKSLTSNKGTVKLSERSENGILYYVYEIDEEISPEETILLNYNLVSSEDTSLGKRNTSTKAIGYVGDYAYHSSKIVYSETRVLENSTKKVKLEKKSSMDKVLVGDTPEYTIKITNNVDQPLWKIEIEDELPIGFNFLEDSIDLKEEGFKLESKKSDKGITISLLGNLEIGQSVTIKYLGEVSDEVQIGEKETLIEGTAYGETSIYSLISQKTKISIPYKLDNSKMLLITKEGNKKTVGIGELIKYEVKIKNTTDKTIKTLKVNDRLPRGFKLLSESPKSDKMDIKELKDGATSSYLLEGELQPGGEEVLTYIARVENAAKQGEAVNKAWATGYATNRYYNSNIASYKVEVEDDLFDEKGIIFGRVYIDVNENNIFDNTDENKEIGVPGIKIYLENGDYAITDKEGMYSIYGQRSITHVVKIDRYTIPTGATLTKLTNRHNDKGDLSYADLKNGQLHKVNFAFKDASSEFIEKVKSRRSSKEGFYNELEYELKRDYVFKSDENIDSSKESFKVKDGHDEINFTQKEKYDSPLTEIQNEETTLEDRLMVMENELGFIDLKDGDTIRNNATIRVKGPRGGYLNLYVNDNLVPLDNLGSRASSQKNNLFFLEYNMVPLKEGKNNITVAFSDMFEIERERKTITVIVPGKQEDIQIEVISSPIANPNKPIEIRVIATDGNGRKIASNFPLEAEADDGRWFGEKFSQDKEASAYKVNGKMGEHIFRYIPPADPKTINMRFTSNLIEKNLELKLYPDLRPLTASGIIEGRYDKNKKSNDKAIDNYVFEESLEGFDPTSSSSYSSRNALFAKGAVGGEYLLTLSYDDNKKEDNFFKDIEADKHYPIYGDSSIRGYDAKSTSNLFLKIDKNYSSLLYGDYTADWTKDETSKLGKVNRTLTGGYHKYDAGKFEIHTFAAETEYKHATEEQRGKGISGPYHLKCSDIVVGSETITLIVRDRVLSSVVLEEKTLSRNTDYTMDYETGSIYFAEPIMSTTPEFNPIFIKTEYEIENGGEKYWVWGNNLEYKLTENLRLGWNYVKDDNPDEELEVSSIFSRIDINENTISTIEYAETDSLEYGKGAGWRADFKMKTKATLLELEYFDTEKEFDNDSSSISRGRQSYNLNVEQSLEGGTKLFFKSKFEEDKINNEERSETEGGISKRISENLRLEVKGRYAKEEAEENNDSTSIGTRLTQNSKQIDGLVNFVEYEQDITEHEKRRLAMGSDYQMENKTKLYLRQELFSTFEDSFALTPSDSSNATLIGVESDYFDTATVFSEYSVQNSSSEKESKASMGVKKNIQITEDLSGAATLERIFPISYEDSSKKEESTAATLSYKWDVDKNKKMTGNIEGSVGNKKDIFTNRLGYVEKINDSDSIIMKERYIWEKDQDNEKRIKSRITFGFAHRDYDIDKSNWLLKYEVNYERETKDRYTHKAHILNHARNYQISENRNRTLTVAGKYVEERLEGYESNYFAYMTAASYSIDLTEKLDINFNMAVYGDEDFNEYRYGVGAEVGVRVMDNLWISGGYNITGFTDDDFDEYGYYREGIYIRFRINFTEDVFNINKKQNSK